MFHYKAFGLEISSEVELPGMTPGSENPDVQIIRGEVNHSQVIHVDVEGSNYLVSGEDVYLWWDDIGRVKISEGKRVTVDPIADLEGSDEINVIPFILGPVMALLLHQRGFLVLHGSSIRVKERAVAFLGYRGNGKSTTAIHLYQDGYPLVTDDILAIKFREEGLPVVYPGYPHVRLNEDSYNQVKTKTDILTPIRTIAGKIFCDASHGFSSEPVDLERIYVIEKDDKMGISNLKSQDNLLDLVRHSVANRIFQYNTQKENLIHCAQLVNNVTVKKLEVSHSFRKIKELVKMIEEDLESED
ncbi:MAG: hypothetical protein KO316_09755 [Methanobacterium sp.]|jgi:hypothetical protein|nr:hypothetical protein [Methanobacterium sp.]